VLRLIQIVLKKNVVPKIFDAYSSRQSDRRLWLDKDFKFMPTKQQRIDEAAYKH
jgi:hypothetical protein